MAGAETSSAGAGLHDGNEFAAGAVVLAKS